LVQHEPLRIANHAWITRDPCCRTEPFEGFLHAAQVAAAVVDDRDHAVFRIL
jgi:hypothetical protein